MTKKEKISLVFNCLIAVFAVFGSVLCFGEIYIIPTVPIEHGIKMFKFFTVQSNVLAGVVAIVYIIYLITQNKTKKQMPLFVYILKFIVTIDLIITFLVVALFLGFIVEEGYFSLYTNANLFFH
ncbi:MAG: hypothetical protein IJT25_00955, partial [Clostridia bacterium]|nr:hypothetical protein [Clostridia bacterium]